MVITLMCLTRRSASIRQRLLQIPMNEYASVGSDSCHLSRLKGVNIHFTYHVM